MNENESGIELNYKESVEESKVDFKTLCNAIIVVAVGIIIGTAYLIYLEITEAKKDCENLDGFYSFEFPLQHLCNNKTFIKYIDGWDYSREVNLSQLIS